MVFAIFAGNNAYAHFPQVSVPYLCFAIIPFFIVAFNFSKAHISASASYYLYRFRRPVRGAGSG
jgi:hypothetical protein